MALLHHPNLKAYPHGSISIISFVLGSFLFTLSINNIKEFKSIYFLGRHFLFKANFLPRKKVPTIIL